MQNIKHNFMELSLPAPVEVKIEEILRLFLLISLTIYMICHILFIPIEILLAALCVDMEPKSSLGFFVFFLFLKYLCVLIMFYCAYRHNALWNEHTHWDLYLFGTICFLVTAMFAAGIIIADILLKKVGFGGVMNHPFFYDFIGFSICGIQGFVYMVFMACIKSPTHLRGYNAVPQNDDVVGLEPSRCVQQMIQIPIGSNIQHVNTAFGLNLSQPLRCVKQKPLQQMMTIEMTGNIIKAAEIVIHDLSMPLRCVKQAPLQQMRKIVPICYC